MGLKEIGFEDEVWIYLAQNGDQLKILGNVTFGFHKMPGIY
jgi:hypothetical protein